MKKIRTSILVPFLSLTIPMFGMEQNPIGDLYSKIANKEMPALRKGLKAQSDATLLALLEYRQDGNTQNLIRLANACSWELLSRFCTKINLQEYFENKKALPQISPQNQKSLKLNFFKFIGLYIADPAPNEKQERALLAIQAMPQTSIAQFVFVGTDKLLILKNDYKTLVLFDPNQTPALELSAQELAGTNKLIKLDVIKQQSHLIPLFVSVPLDPKQSSAQVPLSLDQNKIRISGARGAVPIDTNAVFFIILMLFHDLNTKQISTDNLTINNLLFLAYLYHFPNIAIRDNSNILKESYATYYNGLPKEIRDRLNLRVEKNETYASKELYEEKVEFLKKAAQQVWWKRYPTYIWNTVKTPFAFVWTKLSSWWNK